MDEQKDVSLELDTEQTNNNEGQDPSDKLTPEHPRFKEVIAQNHELKQSLEEMKSQMDELKSSISVKQDQGEETDEEEIALRKIERRMEEKFARKEDLSADRQALQFDRLSEKYDGSNGYPKFVPVDVTAYAKRNGFGNNYEAAYRQMHFNALVQVEARKAGFTPPTSEKPTGGEKQQEGSILTPQDIANMSDEEYEKNRDKILAQTRPQS